MKKQTPLLSYYPFMIWILLLFLSTIAIAQEKQSIQIKTFDPKLQVLRNIEVSLNGGPFVSVGRKGSVIVELNEQDFPIRTVTIKDEKLEAASWNLSKGIIEIIVRPKSYTMVHFVLRFPNGSPAPQYPVSFHGAKTITLNADQKGEFDLPLALQEKINSAEQFEVQGLIVVMMRLSELENVLTVDHPKIEEPKPVVEEAVNFNLSILDSIRSLPAFYAVFKNIAIKDLNEEARIKIDAKFYHLVSSVKDSLARSHDSFMSNISDTSFVSEDLKSLINYATLESEVLHTNRTDFEEKIIVISGKLEKGISNLSENERQNLLADLDVLEKLLIRNESKFYENQNDYRDIINTLKEKYFDIQNLETRLSTAEKAREEEQRLFRQRLIIIGGVLVVFAILVVLLISFSSRMRKQAREVKSVNEEIQSINENLEAIVIKRTRLLEESNKELDTFLYRASHDLRAPIRSILGLCSISKHITSTELIDRLDGVTHNMDRMLKRLITISEISQQSMNVSGLEVRSVLENVKTKDLALIQESGVQFHIDCPPDLKIHSSAALLESILTNLVENAIYFSSLKNKDHARVELKAEQKGASVELSVYDNGVGIDDSIRPKLFQMFFIGHERSDGNGLGLYTVYKCVQALSGKIDVDSEVDRFTRFIISLPVNPATMSLN